MEHTIGTDNRSTVVWKNPPKTDKPGGYANKHGMVNGMDRIVEIMSDLIANPGRWALLVSFDQNPNAAGKKKHLPNIYTQRKERNKQLAKLDIVNPEQIEMTRRARTDNPNIIEFYIRYTG